ncbi:hypothetical protein GT037_002123 [Alternaria burnsii]|uniref:Extracellular membrane protein CFEM domain-containing protein n=5 Tax=Alternaria sect. Alternaria TaxID=2499237 RepID=A0A177DUF0_ALTAL|nr:hypothetical protein CC77DRAFT_1059325 [Alternaria alternata]XP_028506849.1 hypothetical protein AA0111_g5649 [Alternaria arborescens]XP_038790462.1 uncharacterized protein GT037_002123 [Alternaria burnsii]XP_051588582.1 uncharacterized protein J4E82_005357 [Alternaria postmessia]KAB2109608.1 hypothetical protein AG0111_0g661 [Alternaria gaisen]RII21296.1 hypothetical protein CUC08_Gglean000458 [Alternaria sp. MG1]RYN55898.1 hypothetical protein AA0114_g3286 [Alternaria tenuissima]KAF7680
MKFTISAVVLALSAFAAAMPQGANANRPVPEGACCVANTSLKQDVCTVNGVSGRCVPDSINNCGAQLTCIEDNRLNCDPNTLERGRPLCRRIQGA